MTQQKTKAKRMAEQRWVIDKAIESTGVDFSWPMTGVTIGAAGLDVIPDVMSIRAMVKKFADISRQFARVAAKRESMAKEAEAQGHLITARDNYFAASIFYGMAQWPITEDDNKEAMGYAARQNACYDRFIPLASHPIERVEIPFQGVSLPGLLHFPSNRKQGKLPCVISTDGMDGFKEQLVPVYGDKFLERGMAVLAFDGPGQGECCRRKIRCTTDNFARAGKAVMDYLVKRPEIDPARIGLTGISMGSFWATQVAAAEDRLKAAAVMLFCHEPGMNAIFNMAAPTFKERYMWMAGYDNEDEFDKFAQALTLKGVGSKIKCPFLMVGGEDDELSPVKHSYDLYDEIAAPKKIVVYQGEKHEIRAMQDALTMVADWISDRLDGKPMQSESIYIDAQGWASKK
jgi:dienelactone hydrolase